MNEAITIPLPWRVSLHGGHSGEFCDHAEGTLRSMLEAAVAAGYHTFGVSEHVPRPESFLYPEEIALGWTAEKIAADFARYTLAIQEMVAEFADRLVVLRGFEAEVVPPVEYARIMRGYREQRAPEGASLFDYCVGSVHFVDGIQIDGPPENYLKAVEACGGIEALAVQYYHTLAEMVQALRPEVVGHLDLIKKNVRRAGFEPAALESSAVRAAVEQALEAVSAHDGILDLNTAGWRKGLGEPYPAPELVRLAHRMGVPFCFGDDSHRPTEVGMGLDAARDYLLQNGVESITALTRDGSSIVRHIASL